MEFRKNIKLTTHIYKNPKHNIILEFGRHNETYEVMKEKVIPLEYCKSFKELILETSTIPSTNNRPTFGVARTLEPLTQTINKMKATIDNANSAREQMIKDYQQKIINLQNQEKGETKND